MSCMSQPELVVAYNAVPTASRVARARQTLVFRAISAVVSLAIVIFLLRVVGQDWAATVRWGTFLVWGVVTAVWFALSIISLVRARADLQRVGVGPALVLSPQGVQIDGRRFTWPEVAAIKVVGSDVGAGPRFVVEPVSGESASIPLSFLDAMPGTLDSAARAYSLGRHGVDLARLDSMF